MQEERLERYASQWLGSKPTLYAVKSEAVRGVYYACKRDDFMVLRGKLMYHIDLHKEADEWIRKCKVPEMAEEMEEIVADCRENRRGDLIFGQRMVPGESVGRTVCLPRSILNQIGG